MTLFKKIDVKTGNFIEDVLLDSRPLLDGLDDDGNVIYDPQYVETPVPQGFYLPKWNGTKWIEGGVAPDEIIAVQNLEERVQNLEETIIALTLF